MFCFCFTCTIDFQWEPKSQRVVGAGIAGHGLMMVAVEIVDGGRY